MHHPIIVKISVDLRPTKMQELHPKKYLIVLKITLFAALLASKNFGFHQEMCMFHVQNADFSLMSFQIKLLMGISHDEILIFTYPRCTMKKNVPLPGKDLLMAHMVASL